jgi:hypothetical protein
MSLSVAVSASERRGILPDPYDASTANGRVAELRNQTRSGKYRSSLHNKPRKCVDIAKLEIFSQPCAAANRRRERPTVCT